MIKFDICIYFQASPVVIGGRRVAVEPKKSTRGKFGFVFIAYSLSMGSIWLDIIQLHQT